MNQQQLRALVRESVERQFGESESKTPGVRDGDWKTPGDSKTPGVRDDLGHPVSYRSHPSHYTYVTVINTTDACVIEPSVSCDHCGYCKSHGH